jgi:P-type Mg2+ transporter
MPSQQQAHRWAGEEVGTEADEVAHLGRLDPEPCCATVGSSLLGLTSEEAAQRLKSWGPNLVAREAKPSIPQSCGGAPRTRSMPY